MAEARHDATGHPIAAWTYWTYQRIAVGCECKCTVDPAADARFGKGRVALEPDLKFRGDAVNVFRDQIHAIVPWCSVHLPVFEFALVNPQEHPVSFLPGVGKPVEIDDIRQFLFVTGKGGHGFCD